MIGSIEQQIAAVRAEMESRPERLRAHVERVVVEAVDLAQRYDVDPERVELAARGHDLFRAHGPRELLRLAREAAVDVLPEDEASPVMLHGPLAAAVLRERFGVLDQEALSAVRDHTSGDVTMPIIAKIILLADKFERRKRNRRPIMAEIRRQARRDLDAAILCWADWKWVLERERGWATHPVHWHARLRWVAEHHKDVALPPRTDDADWPGLEPATEY